MVALDLQLFYSCAFPCLVFWFLIVFCVSHEGKCGTPTYSSLRALNVRSLPKPALFISCVSPFEVTTEVTRDLKVQSNLLFFLRSPYPGFFFLTTNMNQRDFSQTERVYSSCISFLALVQIQHFFFKVNLTLQSKVKERQNYFSQDHMGHLS